MKGSLRLPAATPLLALALSIGCGSAPAPAERRADRPSPPTASRPVVRAPVDVPSMAPRALPQVDVAVAPALDAPRVALDTATIGARLLVLSADGKEAALSSIRQALDFLGVPYDLRVLTTRPGLVPEQLWSGTRANYQGVILTSGNLAYFDGTAWASALSAAEWRTLWSFEAAFGARQATWYTYPTRDLGFGAPTPLDTTAKPLPLTLTADGRSVFSYMSASGSVTISNAYAYLAAPLDASTKPLLVDAAGNALAAIRTYADGRQNLALTFDGNPNLVHTIALSYGVVSWVANGLFVGDRHVFMGAQVDDLFIENDLWAGGGTYRIGGDDLRLVVAWQKTRQADAVARDWRLHLAFNAVGAEPDAFVPDTLTPVAKEVQGEFAWINHTYDHANLDAVTYDFARSQMATNIDAADTLGLATFSPQSFICPDVSGLRWPPAMSAAFDLGVRYVVTDTSRPGEDNPSPNAGIYNRLQPTILMIPRRPNNLFYNVSTPAQWTSEYNALYRGYWKRDLTYDEILDKESAVLLTYMLKGETDPWMFHQANLRAYDGAHTLLGDLLDRVLVKYKAIFTLPIVSPTMDALGVRTARRMEYDRSGVTATYTPGKSITLTAKSKAVVPVTGLKSTQAESYGGQWVTNVPLCAGETATIALDVPGNVDAPEDHVCP